MTPEAEAPAPEAAPEATATDTPRARMSFDEALAAMSKARETAAKATPSGKAAASEEQPEPNTPDDRDSGDGDASDVEDDQTEEPEDAEGEEADDAESDDDEDADDDDPVFKLADGEEVPLSELTKGYLRQSTFTKKAQALAEQRKQLDQKLTALVDVEQEYRQRAERYGVLMDSLDKIVDQEGEQWKKVNWKELKEDDPHEFLIKRDEYREWQERKGAIEGERKRLSEEQKQEREKVVGELRDRLRESLAEMFPAWSDNTVLRADTSEMAATAKAAGFSEEEMAATLDPRSWKLLWWASQGRKAHATAARAKNGEAKPASEPAAEQPRPVRVMKASGPRPSPRTTVAAKVNALRSKAFKSGSLEDAYAAYTAGRRK